MLTVDDIAGKKLINPTHLDFTRSRSAWLRSVEGVPRLSVMDMRESGVTTRSWQVDGNRLADLDAALAVLNGHKTLEQAVAEANAPPPPSKKYSITAQIEEVDRELEQRDKVYAGLVRKGRMKQSEADIHIDRMRAVRATLAWLQGSEDTIKQRLSY
jgi:hypothetical protein